MGKGGGSSQPSQTPAEAMAAQQAQPFLAEYNSGRLSASDQALVNQANTNQTAVALQSLAGSGMAASSSLGTLVGTVSKPSSTGGFQAGAGSSIDLSKLSLSQQILQSDLQTGMAYLQISSGQAADLAGIQADQSAAMAKSLSVASESLASVLGTAGTQSGTDLNLAQANEQGYTNLEEVTDSGFAYPAASFNGPNSFTGSP